MAGLGLQDAVDKAAIKISSATTAAKSINEQKKTTNEQKKNREEQEKRNKELNELETKKIIMDYTQADMNLHQNEADIAKEMRQQPGKSGTKFFKTDDINKFLNMKYKDADNKYTFATINRDNVMKDPRHTDKRTRAGKAFSKAEKEMDMYYTAEREWLIKTQIHDMLFKQKELYKQQLLNKNLNPEEYEVPKRAI